MDPFRTTLILTSYVTLIVSLPGNIFIIVKNVLDLWKNRRLLLSDWLMLGFSFFSFLQVCNEGFVLYLDLYHLPSNIHVFMYLNMCTLWFSALLSLHFCLKIVQINHWLYICLQRRFPELFPWIIVGFLLGFLILNLYSTIDPKAECSSNTTSSVVSIRCSWLKLIFLTSCFLFTFLCSLSALTILISLMKHVRRIQDNTEGSGSPSMKAHIRAVIEVLDYRVTSLYMATPKVLKGIL
ncbi:taste receptor type 2 member 7-like, partial [Engystomops pustulosus]|uniref:taste receptor type 2 member 7-like n=1 Tax=Engystomops pustulosus TaxID=76066 RepID=UPI003AFB7FE8